MSLRTHGAGPAPGIQKAVAALVAPLLAALVIYLTTGQITGIEQGLTAVSALFGAVLVYLVPNLNSGLTAALKAIVAAAAPLVSFVLLAISTGTINEPELNALIYALVMASAVWLVPNKVQQYNDLR